MDKEGLLQLLDDLLEAHRKYADYWLSEFGCDEQDEETYQKEHEEYVERVCKAKQYLNEFL